jgi:monothiol glutaredoxin
MSEFNRDETLTRISQQLENTAILLYMKGTPEVPQCGFSAQVVNILGEYSYRFGFVNILEHPDIRQYLREHPASQWPTFPQLFVNGELIGGCDIVTEHHNNNELEQILAASVTGKTQS